MRSLAAAIGVLLLLPFSVDPVSGRGLRPIVDRIWFAPSPGSLDMRQLFETPEAWPRYDALVRSDAFARITRDWRKRIALEAGAVKDFYCTADESGMTAAAADTQRSLDAIRSAGGVVNFPS